MFCCPVYVFTSLLFSGVSGFDNPVALLVLSPAVCWSSSTQFDSANILSGDYCYSYSMLLLDIFIYGKYYL
jgi:hypothetical protein